MPKPQDVQGVKQIAILRKSLEEATERSHAWKSVADNRLMYMEAVDRSLENFLEAMKALNVVFGLATPKTKHISADKDNHSGEEIYGLTCKKAIALMTYIDKLAIEASRVQESLDSVLQLATDAMLVSSPKVDAKEKSSVIPLTMDSLKDELERAEDDDSDSSGDEDADDGADDNDSDRDEAPVASNHALVRTSQSLTTKGGPKNAMAAFT